jgi:hypothetical protein
VIDNLPADTMPRLLGRTTTSALILGAVAFLMAVLLGSPLGAVGVAVGMGLSILNLRFMFRQIINADATQERTTKEVRRQLGGRTLARLGVLTVIAIGALIISTPLGVGIVVGLVLYQVVFVANVLRVMLAQGGIN